MHVDLLFLTLLVGTALVVTAVTPAILLVLLLKDMRRSKLW